MGASSAPARPLVTQPATRTSHAARRPRASTASTTAASSSGGSVFGMHTTAVQPPSAAARAPLSTSSASSRPGSRKCTWRSTSPGATTAPSASSTVAPRPASSDGPTSVMTPSTMRTSATRSPSWSSTRPPRTNISGLDNRASCAEQGPEHGHAYGDAVRDLFGDERARRARDLVGDLHPAVHRTRVHDEGVGLQARGARRGEAPTPRVLADRRKQRLVNALLLDAQQIHDIHVGQHLVELG